MDKLDVGVYDEYDPSESADLARIEAREGVRDDGNLNAADERRFAELHFPAGYAGP
jgi:hypothetical protein